MLDPFIEHMRAHLALDKFKGTRTNDFLAIQLFAPGIPARLAFHGQVSIGRDHLEKFRRHKLEMKDHLMIVGDLNSGRQFFLDVSDGVIFLNPHQVTPQTSVCLYRFGLGNQKDGMPHIFGGEFSPVLVELDPLAQREGPGLAIGPHLPLLRQFRNIGPRVPVNPYQIFQGWSFIELATTTLHPGEIGVPA